MTVYWEEYEEKLHLVAKFTKIRDMVRELDGLAETCTKTRIQLMDEIRSLSGKIMAAL